MSRTRTLVFLVLLAAGVAHSRPFLSQFPSTRSNAMAGAGAALSGTASAGFCNPAAPAFLHTLDGCVEVNRLSWAVTYWSSVVVVPLSPRLAAGLFSSGTRFREGPYDGRDYDVGVSLSGAVHEDVGIGLNLKYVGLDWHIEGEPYQLTESSYSVAADIGFLARPLVGRGHPALGASVRNLGPDIKYTDWPHKEPLPRMLVAGVGWSTSARDLGWKCCNWGLPEWLFPQDWLLNAWGTCVSYGFQRLLFAGEAPSHSLGIEFRPLPFIAARAGYFYRGYTYRQSQKGLTWGLGLDLRYFRVDVCEDHRMYSTANAPHYRYAFALNIGEPLVRSGGLFGNRD